MQRERRIGACAVMTTIFVGWLNGAAAHDRVDRLAERIGLFDDQVPQVKAIFDEAAALRQAQRESGTNVDRGAARELVRDKLSLVLTAEQMERFDNLRDERRPKRRHRGRNESGRGE